MSLTSFEQSRRSARRRLVLLVVGILAAGAGITAFFVLGPGDSKGGAHSAGPSAASAPTPAPTGDSAVPTLLPKPGDVKDGVPVGYPHSREGAISAAAHFADVTDLFSPQASEKQAQVMAAPNYHTLIGDYSRLAARKARKDSGLPEDGESDVANYYATQSRAYSVISASADKVSVWLLLDATVSVKGVSTKSTQVRGAVMEWADGDWKLSADTLTELPDQQPSPATPGSPQARAEGWHDLAYEH